MDRVGADFAASVQSIVDRLGARPVPIQLPIGAEDAFEGIIDLVERKAIRYTDSLGDTWEEGDIPEALLADADAARAVLIEAVADHDEEIAMAFLEDEEIDAARLRAAIRACTLDLSITPVLCGSAFKNKGVQPLLGGIVDYLPTPLDKGAVTGTNPKTGEEEVRAPSLDEPFCALAFKIMSDPFVGKLTYFRVYSGVLSAGSHVYNPATGRKERVGRILQMHANSREERESVGAGEIAAAVGLKQVTTGHTLCDEGHQILLESITFPDPVIGLAVEPKTKADQDKLANALARLSEEDPTFRVHTDEETGQVVISGMGELHLEIIVDRLVREFSVAANVGKPQVAYRETIRKPVEKVQGKFVRQTGGRGQYGDAVISLAPNPGKGYEFDNKINGGVIPKEYIKSVDEGIREAMESGTVAGYPVVDVKATLTFGSYHDVDSSEIAFKVAGSMAFKAGMPKADPALLEPVFEVEVETPEEYMGDVIGDLSSRRGRILSMEKRGKTQIVKARVPLSTMFGYATTMRSLSQGRATYTMQFANYEEVPKALADEIIAGR